MNLKEQENMTRYFLFESEYIEKDHDKIIIARRLKNDTTPDRSYYLNRMGEWVQEGEAKITFKTILEAVCVFREHHDEDLLKITHKQFRSFYWVS